MSLNSAPARPLTSREIAKITSAILSAFVDFCGAQAVTDALDHFIEHREKYIEAWHALEVIFQEE